MKNNIPHLFKVALLTVFLVGCSGENDTALPSTIETPTQSPTVGVGGSGLLGIIVRGAVVVFDENGNVLVRGITDSAGDFGPLNVPADYVGPIRIEIRPAADGSTIFKCDYGPGCPDPTSPGSTIAFGDDVPMDLTISAVATSATEIDDISVNPLTSAVAARVEELGGLTVANIEQANAEMAAQLTTLTGVFVSGPIARIPNLDLTAAEQPAGQVDTISVKVALLNASLLGLVTTDSDSDSHNKVVSALASSFRTSGTLPVTSAAGSPVSLSSLLSGSRTAAQSLDANEAVQAGFTAAAGTAILGETVTQLELAQSRIEQGIPSIGGAPATTGVSGQAYQFTPVGFDPDGDTLSYSVANLPSWLTFNEATGGLSGTPQLANVGVHPNIVITVSDGTNSTALASFNITITQALSLAGTPATVVNAGNAFSFRPSVVGGGSSRTFTVTNAPSWTTFSTTNGTLSGTPAESDVGTTSNIQISVTDNAGGSAQLAAFSLEVVSSTVAIPLSISGSATLSVNEGAAYSFTPQAVGDGISGFTIQGLPSWASFNEATGLLSGTPSSDDAGIYPDIVISVTGGGTTVSLGSFNIEVVNVNQVPVGTLSISGVLTQNSQLTAVSNFTDADGVPAMVTYQWRRQGAVVAGQTASTYSLTQSDVGSTIRVSVTYTDLGGTVETLNSATSVAVANVNDPVTGSVTVSNTTPAEDDVLTASNTLADADGLGAISLQWLRNGSVIAGATNATYTATQADVGATLSVRASYTDGQGTPESSTSAVTSAVANVNDVATGSLTIDNTTPNEDTLLTATATPVDEDGVPDSSAFSYQWKRGGVDIAGATMQSYTTTQMDVGAAISVSVSFTDNQGGGESLSSSATASVQNVNDSPVGQPIIIGTIREFQVLSAGTSGISDEDGLGGFTYVWKRDGGAIAGATMSDYTLGAADVGAKITLEVSYTDGFGAAESVASDESATVIASIAPVAINFTGVSRYNVVKNHIKYLTLAGWSSSITYNVHDRCDHPGATTNRDGACPMVPQTGIKWSKRYKPYLYGTGGGAINTWTLVTAPASGDLYEGTTLLSAGDTIGNPDFLVYDPNDNFLGDDSFTYSVTDDVATSNIATVELKVYEASNYSSVKPLGIPVPGFGLADTAPADPAEWASNMEKVGWYYIDQNDGSCSDANDYGYPAVPRCSLPNNFTFEVAAGGKAVLRPGTYELPNSSFYQLRMLGAAGNRSWLTGVLDDIDRPIIKINSARAAGSVTALRLYGGHYTIEGVEFDGVNVQQRDPSDGAGLPVHGDNKVFRHNSVMNYPTTVSGTAIFLGGQCGSAGEIDCDQIAPATDDADAVSDTDGLLIFDTRIARNGVVSDVLETERDVHGVTVQGINGFWFLENLCFENAGDCLQIKSRTVVDAYYGHVKCHSEGENCLDVKDFENFIASESDGWDFRIVSYGNSGGNSQIYYLNDEGQQLGNFWVINNRAWDSGGPGVSSKNIAADFYGMGNEIWNTNWGVSLNGSAGGKNIFFNSIADSQTGIFIFSTNAGAENVALNYVHNALDQFDVQVASEGTIGLLDYNYYGANPVTGGYGSNSSPNVAASLADFTTSSSGNREANGVEGADAKLVDVTNFNFIVGDASSDLVDAFNVTEALNAITEFFNHTGEVYTDRDGTVKTMDGTLDAGSDEL